MKYLLVLLLISCKPRIVDNYDYIIIHNGGQKLECDYRDDFGVFARCKDSNGNSYTHVIVKNGVILIKEEK